MDLKKTLHVWSQGNLLAAVNSCRNPYLADGAADPAHYFVPSLQECNIMQIYFLNHTESVPLKGGLLLPQLILQVEQTSLEPSSSASSVPQTKPLVT